MCDTPKLNMESVYSLTSKRKSAYGEEWSGGKRRRLSLDSDSTIASPTAVRDFQNIEPYQFVSLIGSGAFGKVFCAQHSTTGKFVAIKRLSAEMHQEWKKREGNIFNCCHPNVVTAYEKFTSNDYTYIVLELCTQDLGDYLQFTPVLSLNSIKQITFDMLSAVAYLHANRIMHRDLKPKNILLTSDGTAKLTDFGLSRVFGDGELGYDCQKTAGVVTPRYRAPEQLFSSDLYSLSADVWSLGCIVAEMLIGAPIFRATTEMQHIAEILDLLIPPETHLRSQEGLWPGVSQWSFFLQAWNEHESSVQKAEKAKLASQNMSCKLEKLLQDGIDRFGPNSDAEKSEWVELVCQMLRVNPLQRVSAREAIKSPLFCDIDVVPLSQYDDEGEGEVCESVPETFYDCNECGCYNNVEEGLAEGFFDGD
eukprot:Platyproteum_vivax@DN7248_c0_g1_i3.p1